MNRRFFLSSCTVGAVSGLAGCSTLSSFGSKNEQNPLMGENIIFERYDYNELENGDLPQKGGKNYGVSELENLPNIITRDDNGERALHPVATARHLLSLSVS